MNKIILLRSMAKGWESVLFGGFFDRNYRGRKQVQRLSQCLLEEIESRTAEELARYAAKVRGDLLEEPVPRPRTGRDDLENAVFEPFSGRLRRGSAPRRRRRPRSPGPRAPWPCRAPRGLREGSLHSYRIAPRSRGGPRSSSFSKPGRPRSGALRRLKRS